MGLSNLGLRLIAETMRDKNLSGSCMTFGVSGVEGEYSDIQRVLSEANYPYKKIDESEVVYDDATQFGRTVHQDVPFKMLGFSRVDSLDYFPNEKPTYVIDLNKPIDSKYHDRYDMVFDGGTSEHCFNVRESLSNVIKLLKIGGRVVHAVPLSGWINHGFYQFSPTLFFDFYGINGFVELNAKIVVHKPSMLGASYFDYNPSVFFPMDFKGKRAILFFTAKKNEDVKEILNPIQGFYKGHFGGKSESPGITAREQLKWGVERLRKFSPVLYKLAIGLYFRVGLLVRTCYRYKMMITAKRVS